MSVINLNEQNVLYLANALGEETGHKEINEDVFQWYTNSVGEDWLQYLTEINGEVGILAILEFAHPDADDWETAKNDYYSAAWVNSSPQDIWSHLENLAKKIDESIDFDVVLGKETGFLARHEVCMWIPYLTSPEIIKENFKKIKDIQILY